MIASYIIIKYIRIRSDNDGRWKNMSKANQLEIKRKGDEIVSWQVDTANVTPNTILVPDKGIMLLVKADGVSKTKSGNPITMFGLFHPGKNTKLIGGNKPYEKCEIVAIDQNKEFSAEWGLGGDDAIKCNDPLLGVPSELVAFGKYYYKIESYYDFVNAFAVENGVLTRARVREILRDKTSNLFKGLLATELVGGIEQAYANLNNINKHLTKELNKLLNSMGLTVENVMVQRIDFSPEFKLIHTEFNYTIIDNKLKSIRNEGKRDDISVDARFVEDVAVPLINAQNGEVSQPRQERTDRDDRDNKNEFVYCSKCGAKLRVDDKFCKKCGNRVD